MKPFVIAGCGRSGTMGMAQLLNALDIHTSFEEFFSAGRELPESGFVQWLNDNIYMGEVSSLAAPFLLDRESDFVILHQVRNPVRVISSVMGFETWTDKATWPNVEFCKRCLPDILDEDDPLTKSMKYWLQWNQLVEDAGPAKRYKIEDMSSDLILEILSSVGITRELRSIESCLQAYSRTTNTGPHEEVSWSSIPETPLKEQVRQKAKQYGYGEDELRG